MKHLSPAEFVDAAEGGLPASRASHLAACARCREQAAAMRTALDQARGDEPPEPSPLYWRHLSSRIHERVAQERIVPAWRAEPWRQLFGLHGLVPIASTVVLVIAVLAGGLLMKGRGTTVSAPALTAEAAASDLELKAEDSEVWEVLASAAADMPIEDAHAAGLTVATGTIDHAVQRMSPDELSELARLIKSELRGSGD
jgi:hypothetical protein